MKVSKKLGIWMDNTEAHVMALVGDEIETTVIESDFSHTDKNDTGSRSTHTMNNKENHKHATYYKNIGQIIKGYDEVVLFGPTTAKNELLNLLKEDHLFNDIKIELKPTDKMSENQEHAFVKTHFNVH